MLSTSKICGLAALVLVISGCELRPYITYPPPRPDSVETSSTTSTSTSDSTINTVTTESDPPAETATETGPDTAGAGADIIGGSMGGTGSGTTEPVECSCTCPANTAHHVELLCQSLPFDISQCGPISMSEPCEVCTVLWEACIVDGVDTYTCDSIREFCVLQTLAPCNCVGLT